MQLVEHGLRALIDYGLHEVSRHPITSQAKVVFADGNEYLVKPLNRDE